MATAVAVASVALVGALLFRRSLVDCLLFYRRSIPGDAVAPRTRRDHPLWDWRKKGLVIMAASYSSHESSNKIVAFRYACQSPVSVQHMSWRPQQRITMKNGKLYRNDLLYISPSHQTDRLATGWLKRSRHPKSTKAIKTRQQKVDKSIKRTACNSLLFWRLHVVTQHFLVLHVERIRAKQNNDKQQHSIIFIYKNVDIERKVRPRFTSVEWKLH